MKSFLPLNKTALFFFQTYKLNKIDFYLQILFHFLSKIHSIQFVKKLIVVILIYLNLIVDPNLFANETKGEVIVKSEKNYELILTARKFAQGEVILVKIHPKEKGSCKSRTQIECRWEGNSIINCGSRSDRFYTHFA